MVTAKAEVAVARSTAKTAALRWSRRLNAEERVVNMVGVRKREESTSDAWKGEYAVMRKGAARPASAGKFGERRPGEGPVKHAKGREKRSELESP